MISKVREITTIAMLKSPSFLNPHSKWSWSFHLFEMINNRKTVSKEEYFGLSLRDRWRFGITSNNKDISLRDRWRVGITPILSTKKRPFFFFFSSPSFFFLYQNIAYFLFFHCS
jgi:hypothetical protein